MSIGHILDRKQESHEKIMEKRNAFNVGRGQDKSEYQPQFELTHLGEPINITEYATLIAAGPSTHVIQMDSFHSMMGPKLKDHHLAKETEFHEMVLKVRPGRARHTFISECKIE